MCSNHFRKSINQLFLFFLRKQLTGKLRWPPEAEKLPEAFDFRDAIIRWFVLTFLGIDNSIKSIKKKMLYDVREQPSTNLFASED